jgi:hypothetical protein
MKKVGIGGACLALTCVFASLSSVQALELSSLTADDLHVGGYTDMGRFQLHRKGAADGEIISRVGARWHIDKAINKNFSAMADLHWMFWRNQSTDIAAFWIAGLKFDADLQAALTYASGNQAIKGGLYNFKYNPDSKNLGEYLLRAEAYPTLLESSQGKDLLAESHTRVAGVEYGRTESSLFSHKAIVYAEQFSDPVYDLNTAYLATASLGMAEVGAGVAWHRLTNLDKDAPSADSATPEGRREAYAKRQGLTTEALKFSLRGRIDFAPLLSLREKLVLYGEVALLGLKSDSLYYTDITERMPVMVGLSVPTGGILTELAVEAEYFKNPYYQQKYLIAETTTPLPTLPDYSRLPNYTKDDWRWSLLAHRALNPWLDIKVRVASDHTRLRNHNGDYEGGRPMTATSGEWYFLARIEYHN